MGNNFSISHITIHMKLPFMGLITCERKDGIRIPVGGGGGTRLNFGMDARCDGRNGTQKKTRTGKNIEILRQ